MLAVSRPSGGTGHVLCHGQETGHLSSAFVLSGGSPATVQVDQAPGRTWTWEARVTRGGASQGTPESETQALGRASGVGLVPMLALPTLWGRDWGKSLLWEARIPHL